MTYFNDKKSLDDSIYIMQKSLIFFGSPDFSASVLQKLHKNSVDLDIKISLIVTQPDRPAGRGLKLQMTLVKKLSLELGLPVFEYTKEKKSDLIEKIKMISPTHGVLYAFNEMITEDIISLFPYGIWNIHPSLLPAFRGSSPIAYPLILGYKGTGVTIIKIAKDLDAGDILASNSYEMTADDTAHTVLEKLSYRGYDLLSDLLKRDKMIAHPQDHALATYTKKLTKEDGYIPLEVLKTWYKGENVKISEIPVIHDYLSRYPKGTPPEYLSPKYLYHLWQGLHPWPGIWTKIPVNEKEMRLKILNVGYNKITQRPTIKSVQLEGKNPISLQQFNESYKIFDSSK